MLDSFNHFINQALLIIAQVYKSQTQSNIPYLSPNWVEIKFDAASLE